MKQFIRNAVATALFLCVAAPAVHAQQLYPTYQLSATHSMSGGLGSDIASSSFVGADGTYYFLNAFNSYATTDDGTAWGRTFTNTDFGALSTGTGNTLTQADTFWGTAGTVCYQIAQRSQNPVTSPYQDDHCDLVGTWVDPATGNWYAVINDEYDFNPFNTTETVTQRVSTGNHSNRILAATSADKGVSWQLIDEIITSPYQHNDAADSTAFPATTWSYGVAGCRFFVDYSTGYFYVAYNNAIKIKPNYGSNIFAWHALARAPISGKMAKGTWNKYYNGTWTQPGVGGLDGGLEPHGLTPNYNPATDAISYTGTGADNSSLNYVLSKVPSTGIFTFKDAAGNTYTANVVATPNTITNSANAPVSSVSYSDPALNNSVSVAIVSGVLQITATTAAGQTFTASPKAGSYIMEEAATNRLLVTGDLMIQSALTYNVYSGKYRSIGYDLNVYETADLGQPVSLSIVGADPTGASNSYMSSIDYGSLTNQNISSSSYRIISDLSTKSWDVTTTAPAAGQTYYAVPRVPVDSSGTAIAGNSNYQISIGGSALETDTVNADAAQWLFVPVADSFNATINSGFYRIKNVHTGTYLQVSGSTQTTQRAIGAAIAYGAALNGYDPNGNSSQGAPGGSDQWYLLPVGNDVPATLSASSSSTTIAQATNTSLANVKTYKIVNRNSGLVLQFASGVPQLAGHVFGNASQVATITLANANVLPVANNVSATVAYNSANNPISLNLTGGAASSVAVASVPTHGTATASGISITYTPNSGFYGSDSFTYTATNSGGTSAPATASITVSPPPVTLTPVADAYIRDGSSANTNFGTATTLVIKNDTNTGFNRKAYLRFDLSSVTAPISQAKVYLTVAATNGVAFGNSAFLVTNNTWSETGITWNNAPAISSTQVGSSWTAPATVGGVISFDATAQAQSAQANGGLLSLAVVSPTYAGATAVVQYASRENTTTGYQPVIVLTTN